MSVVRGSAENHQPNMNLLKPDYRAGAEARKRAASRTGLVFFGLALIIWTMVGLKVWDIGIVIAERRPDELEKVRLNQQISDLQAVLSKVPSGALKAREDLLTQVHWAERLAMIKGLALPGQAFGTYEVQEDGEIQLSGLLREPSVYASMLDKVSKTPFVREVTFSSLVYDEKTACYEFHVSCNTLSTEDK